MTQDTQRRVSELLNALPIAMLAVDHEARIIGANTPAEALFGQDLLHRPFVTVIRHPAIVHAVDWVLDPNGHETPSPDPALPTPPEGGVIVRATVPADGREIAAEMTISRLPLTIGRGVMIAILDQSRTEQTEQMRRDFVANVSHELRTPLTAMIGFIETLRGPAREDVKARDRFLNIMEREAGRMNRLVDDLLSLTRVQSEERRRPSTRIDLVQLLQSVLTTMQHSAEEASVVMETDGFEAQPKIPGDSDQLMQVFQNLIENALKYGASGGRIRVSLWRIEYEPLLRGAGWAVRVEDFGDGIEEMHLPRLTERFYRVDTHRSREQGGTGLGLAIVKHIINRHRGRLRIDSSKGFGSRFTVILPETVERS